MHVLTGIFFPVNRILWRGRKDWWGDSQLVRISFRVGTNMMLERREALKSLEAGLKATSVTWVRSSRRAWLIDINGLRKNLDQFEVGEESEPLLTDADWFQGVVSKVPEIRYNKRRAFDTRSIDTYVIFEFYREDFLLDARTRIFLSHKGADKPMVRKFHKLLRELGFQPWLDEDAMPAGTQLHRGILQGFQNSCAAVFFITPEFVDESYLGQEINYAVEQKTAKGDRFSIITLVFRGRKGQEVVVPDLLKTYVWKEPSDELDALTEIIRALPITLGPPDWKPGTYMSEPGASTQAGSSVPESLERGRPVPQSSAIGEPEAEVMLVGAVWPISVQNDVTWMRLVVSQKTIHCDSCQCEFGLTVQPASHF